MKRILCPKCENYLSFDETKYNEGQSLVFICEYCGKQFSIRLGKTSMQNIRKDENTDAEITDTPYGYLTVVENIFGYKQTLKLKEGDNIIGRRCVGSNINQPIESGDMSMDRRHCIIHVKQKKNGTIIQTLCDGPSLTGTFLMNELLQEKDRIVLKEGDIITIGATTLIFHEV